MLTQGNKGDHVITQAKGKIFKKQLPNSIGAMDRSSKINKKEATRKSLITLTIAVSVKRWRWKADC